MLRGKHIAVNLRNQRKRAKFFDRRGSVVIIRHICAALVCFSLIGFLETYAGELHVVSSPMQLVGENGPGFSLMESSEIGISFRNDLDARKGAANRVLFNGSGVAVGDVNGDGLPDLFFCGIDSPNQFYRNLGQWKFERVTIPTSLETLGAASRGAVFADLNGNDRLDLLVSTIGMGVRVFWNQGEFSFQDVTQEFGTETQYGATSMALADVDGNGTLDLYVANYRSNDIRDFARVPVKRVGGKMVPSDELQDRIFIHEGQIHEYGEPDILYLNDGLGKMTPVDWSSGVFRENGRALSEAPKDWGLSVMLRDFSGDGSPDLYVCNDYWTPDRVWINDGHGGFDALPADALNVSSASSMGVDGTDVDGDGNIDLFVVDMLSRNPELRKSQQASESMVANIPSLNGPRFQVNYNTMLLGGGNGRFTDISHFAGLEASDWSWCPIFMDVDLDGIDDVLISAGYPHDMQDSDTLRLIQSRQHSWDRYASDDARQQAFANEMMEHIRLYPTLEMPMVAFRGKGDGTFEEMTQSWGTDIPAVHQGFATGDLDGDGDLDLVVNCLNGPARLYRNNASKDRVAIRLKGRSPNTQAIGSQITVNHSTFKGVTRTLISGGRYLSGGDTGQVFGILPYADTLDLSIVWPDRTQSTLNGLERNHRYIIQQPLEPDKPNDSQLQSKLEISTHSVFSDASDRLNHFSRRAFSGDFVRQPLLSYALSHHGPGLVCMDFDGDGITDVLIGGEHGQQPTIHYGRSNGEFESKELEYRFRNDSAGMLGMVVPGGRVHLFAGQSGYEIPQQPALMELNLQGQYRSFFSNILSGIGPMAAGPLHGEGGLSAFLGGSYQSRQYPLTHPSRLLHQDGTGWRVDESHDALLTAVHRARSAVWSDLNGDGLPELIIATEWGPIRVFQNTKGRLEDRTGEWGVDSFTGLWSGVVTGDMDGNGYPDLIVGNWGRNSPWRASVDRPLTLYHGDLLKTDVRDLIETEYHENGTIAPSRSLTELGSSLPFLFQQSVSYKHFGSLSAREHFSGYLNELETLEVSTLDSCLFLNTGKGSFKRVVLPDEVQWAPVFGLQVGDFNGDGVEDLILGQNQSHVREGMPPQNQGGALLLEGRGDGEFLVLDNEASGLNIRGDIRGLALADFDQDGRLDCVMTQNEGATKVYLNQATSKPGLRVRLKNVSKNPHGIGAQLRLIHVDGSMSPLREVQAGNGWYSQNSPVSVLHGSGPIKALWVRWPGGMVKIYPLKPDQLELMVNP